MKKKIKLETGKYYESDGQFFRVDYFDHMDDPMGVLISFFKGHSSICTNTDLDFYTFCNKPQEITKEEFEEKLEQAHMEFTKLIDEIKK